MSAVPVLWFRQARQRSPRMEKICAFPDCGPSPRLIKGFCPTHDGQRRRGRPLRPKRVRMSRIGTCSYADCDRQISARGLCGGHYAQWRADVALTPLREQNSKNKGLMCAGPECELPARSQGLCHGHHAQRAKGHDLTPIFTADPNKRVLARLEKNSRVVPETGCVEWTGATRRGYGGLTYAGKADTAHRVIWTVLNGPIPAGVVVHHKCANRLCFNIDHLQLVSHVDNTAEMLGRRSYVARIAELEAQVVELTAELERMRGLAA